MTRLAAFNRAQSCRDLIPRDLTHVFVEDVPRTRDVSIGGGGSNLHWRVRGRGCFRKAKFKLRSAPQSFCRSCSLRYKFGDDAILVVETAKLRVESAGRSPLTTIRGGCAYLQCCAVPREKEDLHIRLLLARPRRARLANFGKTSRATCPYSSREGNGRVKLLTSWSEMSLGRITGKARTSVELVITCVSVRPTLEPSGGF